MRTDWDQAGLAQKDEGNSGPLTAPETKEQKVKRRQETVERDQEKLAAMLLFHMDRPQDSMYTSKCWSELIVYSFLHTLEAAENRPVW